MVQRQCCKKFQCLSSHEKTILRDHVIQYIIKYSNLQYYKNDFENVRQQLYLGIVFIVLQQGMTIQDILQTFCTNELESALLVILELLAEEAQRWRIPCSLKMKKCVAKV